MSNLGMTLRGVRPSKKGQPGYDTKGIRSSKKK